MNFNTLILLSFNKLAKFTSLGLIIYFFVSCAPKNASWPESKTTEPCSLIYPAWDADESICNSESDTSIIVAKRNLVYFKMFLEAYGKLEFGDSKFIVSNALPYSADGMLYNLVQLEREDSMAYRNEYGSYECCWVSKYDPCRLYIPEILGHIIKLAELLNINPASTKDAFYDSAYIKGFLAFEKELYNSDYYYKSRTVLEDTIINPKFRIELLEYCFSGQGPKRRVLTHQDNLNLFDIDDKVEFHSAEPLVAKYFGSEKLNNANNLKAIKRNWNSVMLIVHSDSIMSFNKDYVTIKNKKLKHKEYYKNKKPYELCMSEPFLEQPSFESFGTGFLINDSTVLTTAHHFMEMNYEISKLVLLHPFKDYRLITGVELDSTNNKNFKILAHKKNIYRINKNIFNLNDINKCYLYSNDNGPDWAAIPVVKEYTNYHYNASPPSLELKIIEEGQNIKPPLYCIGHPLGLPKKIAFEGSLINNNFGDCFSCSLDVFGGNSGSPVFDARDNKVVGILIGGIGVPDEEFEFNADSTCLKMKVDTISNKYAGHYVQRLKLVACDEKNNLQ